MRTAGPRDPIEALLDFLLILRRFVSTWGPRTPPEDLDAVLTRMYGPRLHSVRRRRRRWRALAER